MATPPFPLLADRFASRPEFGRTDHLLVDANPAATWKALRELDLTELRGGVAGFAVWFRDVPERWRARKHGPARERTRLTWDDLDAGTDWMILGENPGHEIVLGAVGKFWRPVVKWVPCEPRDFLDFAGFRGPIPEQRAEGPPQLRRLVGDHVQQDRVEHPEAPWRSRQIKWVTVAV